MGTHAESGARAMEEGIMGNKRMPNKDMLWETSCESWKASGEQCSEQAEVTVEVDGDTVTLCLQCMEDLGLEPAE